MNAANLPPLSKTSSAYLAVLLAMVVGFYVLLIASLVAVGFALYELVMWTPTYLSHARGGGAIKLLFLIYAAVCVFGWALIKGFLAKVGGDPFGIKANRRDHPKVFDLTNEVAQRVQADPIHEIFLTPEDELGVWEEAALYLPPGMGKRKIVLGMGALNYLTIDQLRSILAHEYGHFSNRDTFFSRFIYRVANSYDALLRQLGLDEGMETDTLALVRNGAPSAAEELFGENLPNVQAELSEMVSGKYICLIEMMRRAQEQ